jgi:hypothetical protein
LSNRTLTDRKHNFKSSRGMTFKEIREAQRIAETAGLGPGATGDPKPFGSDLPKVDFGRKYEFKP